MVVILENICFIWERGSDSAGGFNGVLQSLSQGDFRALANCGSIGVRGDQSYWCKEQIMERRRRVQGTSWGSELRSHLALEVPRK